ncbi:hypothetical protein GWK90_06800 [Candidatus Hamiltonella defensa]|uniref:Uncharacterized protein n=2 Tax=Candidatus Williamhamiltonella defendens TaxID=138072 RepID=A0AAC9VIJ9_9ENTR|nr:hypothetical protein [Candidatus Hamiltonella defensa]ASV32961.1 hypothetical protein CJJ18_01145 [Candidatus Hamiltonella defensa]AWK15914.1 hypothetical protein CCS40_01135 [Candidatus Hamiltonella defensa]MBK4361945.1 hypothetical protein [Candidatus Hamiltonella defensa]
MENIQNEFQNAIKTEQFDDKTIQDLYKRTNKMFKEDSILRSYFPGYLKQKTNPLMDALENLKTLVTPTKDSIVDKMILGTFCIFNVVAGQSSGMTTSSTEGGALEGLVGAVTTMSFNGIPEHDAHAQENKVQDERKYAYKDAERGNKSIKREGLRKERDENLKIFNDSCEQQRQNTTNKRKQKEFNSAIEARGTTNTPEQITVNRQYSIPADNSVSDIIGDNNDSHTQANTSSVTTEKADNAVIKNKNVTKTFSNTPSTSLTNNIYNPEPKDQLHFDSENMAVWESASPSPGQWFTGLVETQTGAIKIVPVNIFGGQNGKLNELTLNNTGANSINRYASGVPGERNGKSIEPSWLSHRNGSTPHTAIAFKYGFNQESCLGFSLIKTTKNGEFAQIKFSSTSLNSKPDGEVKHSFSRATASDSKGFPQTAL